MLRSDMIYVDSYFITHQLAQAVHDQIFKLLEKLALGIPEKLRMLFIVLNCCIINLYAVSFTCTSICCVYTRDAYK